MDAGGGDELTQHSGLDGSSRPDWYVPAGQLPPAGRSASTSPRPSGAASSTPGRPAPPAGAWASGAAAPASWVERLARGRPRGQRPVPRPRSRSSVDCRRASRQDLAGVEQFAALVLEAALPFAAAVKPNLAFYEAFGSAGIAALERLRARIPATCRCCSTPRRADIGTTAARQTAAIDGRAGGGRRDVEPVPRRDAIDPFLARDAFVYIVCRTSNPAAAEVQESSWLPDETRAWPAEPSTRGSPGSRPRLGAGRPTGPRRRGHRASASSPNFARSSRIAPFLVPGIGAQGGDLEATLAQGPATAGTRAATAVAASWSTFRGASRGRRRDAPNGTSQEHVRRADSCGRRRLGREDACAIVSGA